MQTELIYDLFFGNVTCHLAEASGSTFSPVSLQIAPRTEQSVEEANKYLQPFTESDVSIIMPSIPGLKILAERGSLNEIPRPLIKSENGPIAGVQSGIRSALLKSPSGHWLRLKGCGNNYDGFPLHPVRFRSEYMHCLNIRGCSFEVTCFRELYFAGKVNELLAKAGIPLGNVPVGWFEYDTPDHPIQSVKKLCGVFQTPGDKRLNDHVISGLEILLENVQFDANALLSAVPEIRLNMENPKVIDSTWWTQLLQGSPEDAVYADIYSFPLTIGTFNKPSSLPPKYHALWDECCSQIQSSGDLKGPGSLFSYLYWRLGAEAGAVQRLLTENDISWGTYTDLLYEHCNAHPNNLVLLPEGSSNTHFLAPVDLDMAFQRDEFTREPPLFDEWVAKESQALAMELAGAGSNTGVRGLHEYSDQNYDSLRWALRDTMLRGYYTTLFNSSDEHPALPDIHSAAYSLLKLALLCTTSNIA